MQVVEARGTSHGLQGHLDGLLCAAAQSSGPVLVVHAAKQGILLLLLRLLGRAKERWCCGLGLLLLLLLLSVHVCEQRGRRRCCLLC
jgi:hypothetical protein